MENLERVILFNTKGRRLQEFKSIKEGEVGMYSCGPTVYGRAHIGNMRAYVFADTLKRVLMYAGYKVNHVMNITDVGHLTSDADEGEDKLAKAARESHETAWEISKRWTEQFFKDTKSLNVLPVTTACKATEHIAEQIALVQKLEEKGYTYRTSDGIYFDTAKFPHYGDFAHLDIEGLQAGIRVDMSEKRNKTDFALWKFSKPTEKRDMEWDSPWGVGFPGWHIECSAMSMKYLGEKFDIHTGGIDHVTIHHTNEIAQSECATGHTFVNYWIHCEFLTMSNAEKMSKSLGNVVNIDTLREYGIKPLAFRYLCLNAHYRKQLLYSKEILMGANNAYNKWCAFMEKLKEENPKMLPLNQLSEASAKYLDEFKQGIFYNLNTPQALATMWNLIHDKNINNDEKYTLLMEFDKVFGLTEVETEKPAEVEIPAEVLDLLDQRNRYRAEKNWAQADAARDAIKAKGYTIVDTKEGSKLQRI